MPQAAPGTVRNMGKVALRVPQLFNNKRGAESEDEVQQLVGCVGGGGDVRVKWMSR